jgi:hypothetical protein
MACYDEEENTDKVKPLDELLEDNLMEFESGEDRECDRDLDEMIWKLGDYENEEEPQEAEGFPEALPLEEELVEKALRGSGEGQTDFRETEYGEKTGAAAPIGFGKERRAKSPAARVVRKKKNRSRGIAAY